MNTQYSRKQLLDHIFASLGIDDINKEKFYSMSYEELEKESWLCSLI